MSTPINTFYPGLRIMLGDLNACVQRYADGTLLDGVRTALALNKMPGYAVDTDLISVTPDIVGPGLDPNKFALLSYHTVKLFVDPMPDRYAFRTRAFSESVGSRNRFLQTLELEIHKLENGCMFSAWQNYFAWLSGMAGLPLAEVLTDFHVQAPLWNATLTREGLHTIPDQMRPGVPVGR
ncbi:MAG TPA: hypothetical protein VMU04_10170 [Candidatus Acidoferrum sp.]|nr:hypothetical protein [Candidatus Acidoferrum sp.]